MNRRDFLSHSAAGAFSLSALPINLTPKMPRVYRTALIGSGWWGMNILQTAMAYGQSQVVGICDVDDSQLEAAASKIDALGGQKPKQFKDYRDLLAETNPEIVIVATPDHWHAWPA